MMKVSASIMCADFLDLRKTIEILNKEQYDYIHFDVMDGSFFPDYLLGNKIIDDVKSISKTDHEYHLMIKNPEKYIDLLNVSKNDSIIVHYELCENIPVLLDQIREKGCRVGLAIDAPTPPEAVSRYYKKIDLLMVMLIHAGRMGSEFQANCLEKIKNIRAKIDSNGRSIEIGVDGSVNVNTIPKLKELGVTHFVGGSTGLFLRGLPFEQCAREFKQIVLS